MKTLKFGGYGDDTFGEYGVTNEDYDNCATCKPIQCIVDCGEYGRIMVIGQYTMASCNNGCWMIGVSPVEEDDELPDWNYRYEKSDRNDSLSLLIDIPDVDFNLVWYSNGNKVK